MFSNQNRRVGFKVGFYDFGGGEIDKKPGGFYWAGWVDANPGRIVPKLRV